MAQIIDAILTVIWLLIGFFVLSRKERPRKADYALCWIALMIRFLFC